MEDIRINSISEIQAFLQANDNVSFNIPSQKERYELISEILVKFKYRKLKKKHKGIVKRYLIKLTGYSNIQIKRIIKRWKKKGLVPDTREKNKGSFKRIYGPEDIALLIKTDSAHKAVNGRATKEILNREYNLFGKKDYETIANISVSHIYNIRNNNRQYNSSEAKHYTKTNPVSIDIGERRKPDPRGKPGYLRIDTVHQGDLDKEKGVYHINIVDEVTQWEIVGCVEKISEYYLEPLLEDLLKHYPFKIFNFHSDNGGEYINKIVAKLLKKLLIKQTKSRSRHCNDNALVECKNGHVIRKHMGRNYISKKYAAMINEFYRKYFNVYLNYHRICGFADKKIDKKGKEKKVYDVYLTPYEMFKSLPNASKFLKDGVSFEILDKIAYNESDNDFAERMNKAKEKLFKNL